MRKTNAIIIAAASSGSGKTIFTLGLLEALRKRGIPVQPFKAGPDYIDPNLHRAVTGRPSYNLDTWIMGADGVRRTFRKKAKGAYGVVEGVMGLYDGRDGKCEEGSTAHLSKVLRVPVLLLINAGKMARSAGAIIKGFEAYDPRVDIRWVVFNNVGSQKHFSILKDSLPKGTKVKVLGYLPKDDGLMLPSRHLGLVGKGDIKEDKWKSFIDNASGIIEKHIDISCLIEGIPDEKQKAKRAEDSTSKVRIAVASDKAFLFYYEENLEILRSFGAEVVPFSPLKDKRLPEGISGIYLGGGYPELEAKRLEANGAMRQGIKEASNAGIPVYAECGGLMYLGESIETDGKIFKMAGVFPWASRMLPRRRSLGYREVRLKKGSPFYCDGTIRGHEFHYSEIYGPNPVKKAYAIVSGGEGLEGYYLKNTLASYIHLHFAGNPGFADSFIKACEAFQRRKRK